MNQPRTEIYLPCTSDDIRKWVERMAVENPIGQVGDGYVSLDQTRDLHGGVELTFALDDLPLFSLAVFGEANDSEREMEMGA